ncbi:MAG: DUF2332 domain-containing protein [Propionicimonas sp.]
MSKMVWSSVNDYAGERALLTEFVTVAGRRAPLYAAFAAGAAEQPEVLSILAAAPAASRLPVTLFAAIHFLLLADPGEPLAAWYPNLVDQPRTDDGIPALVEFCQRRRGELIDIVTSRVPQTNEIGRSAVLMLGLTQVADEVGALGQVDVGASAGLNLLSDRYRYRWGDQVVGGGDIEVSCRIDGALPTGFPPSDLARIASRVGLDRAPVDIGDPDQVRWLEACVWPDQADRFVRLRAALDQAVALRPLVVAGDAVDDLAATVARIDAGHPVITTSWVLNYLDQTDQARFWAQLNALGRQQDLSWVAYEAPDLTRGLSWPESHAHESLSVLRVARWRHGRLDDAVVGRGHPHGYWLEWGSALTAVAAQHL